MSLLNKAKLPSLKDKHDAQADERVAQVEALREELEVKDSKEEVIKKKSSIKNKRK